MCGVCTDVCSLVTNSMICTLLHFDPQNFLLLLQLIREYMYFYKTHCTSLKIKISSTEKININQRFFHPAKEFTKSYLPSVYFKYKIYTKVLNSLHQEYIKVYLKCT